MAKKHDIVNITVKDAEVGVLRVGNIDYISLTDLAKYANYNDPSGVIRNWMSNKDSFAYYGLWEEINNPNFNSVEFHGIKINEAPYNRFTMTPARFKKDFNEWISVKSDLHFAGIIRDIKEGEVWWCSMGAGLSQILI